MSDRLYTALLKEVQKTRLRTQIFSIPAHSSYELTLPRNYRGILFTIPLTSGLDAWGIYGLVSQGQTTNWLMYYKTLAGNSYITWTQSSTTEFPTINNGTGYAVTALVIGNSDILGGVTKLLPLLSSFGRVVMA